MNRRRYSSLLTVCGLLAATGLPASGKEPPSKAAPPPATASAEPLAKDAPGSDWVRLATSARGEPQAMQTAIARYTGVHRPSGRVVEVDLIGAVHMGDARYYQTLNDRFRRYDALLYELVAPEGAVVEPNEQVSSRNPLGAVQAGMASMLELEHQLAKIDYKAANFVHADMSPEQFFQSMKNRNESILQMYLRMVGQGIAMQNSGEGPAAGSDVEILFALFSKDRSRRLKIAMAKQMAESEAMLAAFGGKKGSTLIEERNRVAFEVLDRTLADGKGRVGVFYGAGHLADMHRRLERDFGLEPKSVEWLDAWDLRPAARR